MRQLWAAALVATAAAFELASFTYSAGEGLLTLTFDEAVQSRTLNASGIVLQSNATAERAPMQRFRLRGAHPTLGQFLYTTPYNTTETLTLVMRDDDLLEVQALSDLAIDAKSVWLVAEEGLARAVSDNDRSAAITKPLEVDTYVPDTLQSEMELYTIDMHEGLICFKFLEPVDRASLDLSGVILQTDVNVLDVDTGYECRNVDQDSCVQLTLVNEESKLLDIPCKPTNVSSTNNNSVTTWSIVCLNTTTVEDSLWLNVSLGPTNLNAIKAAYPLGSQAHLTNLALSAPIANDRGGNAFLTISLRPEMALTPESWIGDQNRPLLVSFAVDMDSGQIDLTFNETVNANELDVTCVSLHETRDNRTGGLFHYLRSYGPQGARTKGSLVSTGDGPTLVIQMSREDSDEIKRKPRLLTGRDTSYVALDCDETYRDNAFPVNFGIRRSRVDALQAEVFVPDTTRPVLTSASLDLDVKILTLEFDETVNASSLIVDYLQVQSTERDLSYTERVQLESYVTAGDIRHDRLSRRGSGRISPAGSNVSIAIGDRDFAAMKLATTFGSDATSTFVAAFGGAVLDMNGNKLTEVPLSKAVAATNGVFRDNQPPSLNSFALDLDSGVFALQFDEPVTRASLDMTKCTLAAADNEDSERVLFTNTHEFLEADDLDAVRVRRLLRLDFDPVTDSQGSEVLYVKLSQTDLNNLKIAETLAVDIQSTKWLSELGWVSDSVTENPSPSVTYETARNFSTDVTSPLLTGGTVDLDAAILTLQADEPVRGASANASYFRISSRADGSGHTVDVDADTLLSPDAKDATSLNFRLDCYTLDQLKLWGPHQAFLSHQPFRYEHGGGLTDMYGNTLAVVNGSKNTSLPATVVADFTSPSLIGFDFGANITLRFDEPVDPVSLRDMDEAWYLQKRADSMSGFQSIRIASHSTPSRTLEAGIGRYAMSFIDADTQFGTQPADTFLRPVMVAAALDIAGNPLESIGDGSALQLGPRVLSFELDMDAGVLVLQFSEPVDTTTFDASKFGLQAQSSVLALTETLSLSAGTSIQHRTGPCEPSATLTLTENDVEDLRFMTALTRGTGQTYLTALSDAAVDKDVAPYLEANALIQIPTSKGLPAANVYPDETQPNFMNCELDMDSNLLTLKFDEPVRALSFDAARVELRDAHATENKTEFVVLSSGSTSSTDAYHLQVELGERDVFAIKSRPPLGQTRNSTYCGVRSGTVLDCGAGTTEEGNRNVAGTRQAMKVLPDVTPPDLKKFDMDLDANALVLTFDEPVNVSSIDPTMRDVYLHAGPEEDDAVVTLGCSKIEPSTLTWNATVSILLCQRDFNNIFATPALCRRTDSCYMSHVFGLAADSAKPPNEARARSLDYALQASAILPDVTPPIVTSFGLDLNQGLLSFEFDEVVHLPSFDVSTITLQSARFNDFVGSRTLSADNGTECFYEDVNATYANVRLGRDDLDAIKALAGVGLALDAETTFLSHEIGLVEDVSGNPSDELQSYKGMGPANNFTRDSTPPKLLSLQKVSMTKKILYAIFDEPVDHEGFNRSHWFLSRSQVGGHYSLGDDVTVEVIDPFTEEDGGVLADDKAPYSSILALRLGDAYDGMPVSDQPVTFLALDDWAISDTALKKQNPLIGDDEYASTYHPGTGGRRATMLGPQLEAFALDMNALSLTLQFTSPILANHTSLDLSKFTLQAASDATKEYSKGVPTASVTLSSSSKAYAAVKLPRTEAKLLKSQLLDAPEYPLDSDGDVAVRCSLSKDDAWKLQRASQLLGKHASKTYASFSSSLGGSDSDSSLVGDPTYLVSVPTDRGTSLDEDAFRRDATRPSLTQYALDLDGGILELDFDEPVIGETINVSAITLKTAQTWPYDSVTLSANSRVVKTDPGGRYDQCGDSAGNRSKSCDYARILLHANDFDRVRAAKAGEWLDISRKAAEDAFGNNVNIRSESTSLGVGTFTKDSTAPQLTSFLLDIDGDGKLHLNFSEPVDPTSWDVSKVELRSTSGATDLSDGKAYQLTQASSSQTAGVTTLELRLGGDLVALKRAIAGKGIGSIGAAPSSTFLAASSGYVTDLAFPGNPNDAAPVQMAASSTVNDLTGPRLASFELNLEDGTLELFFNEPIRVALSGTAEFNASSLILRSEDMVAPVRLTTAASGAAMIFDCQARVTLSTADKNALSTAKIGGDYGAQLQHLGGVLKDVVGGNDALVGAGPPGGVKADGSFNFENGLSGLGENSALPEGPVPVEQILDLEQGTLKISFFHDVRMNKQVNVTAVTVAAADEADAFSYRLTGGTYAVDAAYDGAGEAIITLTLSKADIDGIKLADGKPGIMPLATSVSTTIVGLDASFIWSSTGKQNVPRLPGDTLIGGVPCRTVTTDSTRPTVSSYALDMDAGTLTLEWDEPVRASESVVTLVEVRKSAQASLDVMTLTSSTRPKEGGASSTVTFLLSREDLDELKRIDGLASNKSTSYIYFPAFTFLDRSVEENTAAATISQVSTYVADTTVPNLDGYTLDIEARTLTLHFNEPVLISSFNASCIQLQEDLKSTDGQFHRLVDSYAVDTSLHDSSAVADLEIAFSDYDYDTINGLSRLAKVESAVRMTMDACAAVDVAGNRVDPIIDRAARSSIAFRPDSTNPELLRFTIDMDEGTLTTNFTEPVFYGYVDATKFSLHSSDEGGVSVTLSEATTQKTLDSLSSFYYYDGRAEEGRVDYYGYGGELTLVLDDADLDAIKASDIAVDAQSTYLTAQAGGVGDMTGNTLDPTLLRKPSASYLPDVTPPTLSSFDLDLDEGLLHIEFGESVDEDTLDLSKILLTPDGYAWEVGTNKEKGTNLVGGAKRTEFAAQGVDVDRGNGTLSAQVYVDLGETNLDALKVAGVGVDGTAFLSADEGAIYDMASLPLVRVSTADFEGGNPVKARLLTKDVTGPSLLRANFAGDDLVLEFDEPVVVDDAIPRLVSIVDEDGLGDPLDALVPVRGGGRRGRNAKRRVVLDLKDRCSADEVCRIKIITNATNTTEANTTLVCTQPACDVEKAFEISQRSDLYVTLGAGFVRDHFGNPSEGNTGLKERDPVCDCKSGTFVQTPCTDRIDVMCAACSTECPAGQYKVSECDTHSDIGCLPCRSCQTPYFVDGGCTGSTDTICSECTPCGPLEYEVSPCTAGINRVCKSCEDNSECIEVTPVCENTPAKWWRKANCCYDNDGVQLPCNQVTEANTRISKRNSREHWVFGRTVPQVEDGFALGDASTS